MLSFLGVPHVRPQPAIMRPASRDLPPFFSPPFPPEGEPAVLRRLVGWGRGHAHLEGKKRGKEKRKINRSTERFTKPPLHKLLPVARGTSFVCLPASSTARPKKRGKVKETNGSAKVNTESRIQLSTRKRGVFMTEKQTRKITTSGKYSKAIILPREFLKKLNWRENQNLEIELDEKKKVIVIRDAS